MKPAFPCPNFPFEQIPVPLQAGCNQIIYLLDDAVVGTYSDKVVMTMVV
jgi:hypothetical protein